MRPIIGKTDVLSSPNASIWISSIRNDTFAFSYAHFEVFVSMDISSWCKATGFLQFYFCGTIFFISSKNLPQRLAILTHKKAVVPTFSIFDYPPFESVPFSSGNKTRKMTDTAGYAAFCGGAFFKYVQAIASHFLFTYQNFVPWVNMKTLVAFWVVSCHIWLKGLGSKNVLYLVFTKH